MVIFNSYVKLPEGMRCFCLAKLAYDIFYDYHKPRIGYHIFIDGWLYVTSAVHHLLAPICGA